MTGKVGISHVEILSQECASFLTRHSVVAPELWCVSLMQKAALGR